MYTLGEFVYKYISMTNTTANTMKFHHFQVFSHTIVVVIIIKCYVIFKYIMETLSNAMFMSK